MGTLAVPLPMPFRTIAKLTLRGGRRRTIKRDKLLNVTFMSASSHLLTVRSDVAASTWRNEQPATSFNRRKIKDQQIYRSPAFLTSR